MDNLSLWQELCFLWNTDMPSESSSGERALQVLRGLEKLGWSHFAGQVGRNIPVSDSDVNDSVDFILYGARQEPLVAIFIGTRSKEWGPSQIASHMKRLNVEFGFWIAHTISVFFSGEPKHEDELFRFMSIPFDASDAEGERFALFFQRLGFDQQAYLPCLLERLNAARDRSEIEQMRHKLASFEIENKIVDVLRAEFPGCREDLFLRAVDGFHIDTARFRRAEATSVGKVEPRQDGVMLWGVALRNKIIPTSCNIGIALQRHLDEEEIRSWEKTHLSQLDIEFWDKEFLRCVLHNPGGAECRTMLEEYKSRFLQTRQHKRVPKSILNTFLIGLFKLQCSAGEKLHTFVEDRFGEIASGSVSAIQNTGRGAGRVFGLLHRDDTPTALFHEYFEVEG